MNDPIPDIHPEDKEQISLCEALDRILNKGAVVAGEITISVANVDLLYLGLQVVLTSVETAGQSAPEDPGPAALLRFCPQTGVIADEAIRTDQDRFQCAQ